MKHGHFNPKNTEHMTRLRSAMRRSQLNLQPWKDRRVATIKQYVGAHYSDNAAPDRVPINMLEAAVGIYSRHLSARVPQVMVTTRSRFKDKAFIFELAMNQLLKEIRYERSMSLATIDAIFTMGIMKVGLTEREKGIEVDGIFHDAGQPFADNVDFDDWVHDVTAKRVEQFGFSGHRYRLPLEYIKESSLYKKKFTSKLTATTWQTHDNQGTEKAESISRDSNTYEDEFQDTIDLWDIWLPHDKLIVTVDDEDGSDPLRIVEWNGPETGPYHLLGFADVPNNVMPLAPAQLWVDLHQLGNELYRKLGRQALRQKTILGVQGANVKDGERVVNARDGETIVLDNPKNSEEFSFGGVDQNTFGFMLSVKALFDEMGGNLSVLGGLSPQSDTATQDQLISRAANKRLAVMSGKATEFNNSVIKDLGWWLWTDPLIEMPLTKREEQTELHVTFSQEEMEGDFLDYAIGINPFSMQDFAPAEKIQAMMALWNNVVQPGRQDIALQGGTVDVIKFIKRIAKLANLESEMSDIIIESGMSPEQMMATIGQSNASAGPKQPAQSVRRNVAQSTPKGHEQVLQQTLLGANPQESQRLSLARQTG